MFQKTFRNSSNAHGRSLEVPSDRLTAFVFRPAYHPACHPAFYPASPAFLERRAVVSFRVWVAPDKGVGPLRMDLKASCLTRAPWEDAAAPAWPMGRTAGTQPGLPALACPAGGVLAEPPVSVCPVGGSPVGAAPVSLSETVSADLRREVVVFLESSL